MPTVTFKDVGRMKRTWSAKLPGTEDALLDAIWHEVRNKGGLASSDLEVGYEDEALTRGGIFVGWFRRVGTFEVVPAPGFGPVGGRGGGEWWVT